MLQPRALRFINPVDPLDLTPNLYLIKSSWLGMHPKVIPTEKEDKPTITLPTISLSTKLFIKIDDLFLNSVIKNNSSR